AYRRADAGSIGPLWLSGPGDRPRGWLRGRPRLLRLTRPRLLRLTRPRLLRLTITRRTDREYRRSAARWGWRVTPRAAPQRLGPGSCGLDERPGAASRH